MMRARTLMLTTSLLMVTACSGGGGGETDGGTDAGGACTAAEDFGCTEHFECKSRAVCEADRGSTICYQSDRGGDGRCTFESLSIPSTDDFASPDLGCYTSFTAPAGPAMVNLRGCVEVFGLDLDTSGGLELSVFRASDGVGGTPLATATSDLDMDVLGEGCPNDGAYDFGAEVIPTNTNLIFKVHDPVTEFADTYTWGEVIRADRAADVGGLQTVSGQEFTVIAVSTYQVFPQTAGISAGIDGADDLTDGVGRTALAGTVSACDRREIANLSVTIDGLSAGRIVDSEGGVEGRLVFTDGNENPDVRRATTNIDGTFAAINILGRDRTLTIDATVGGETVSLGTWTIPTLPDSVTLFSPEGALP